MDNSLMFNHCVPIDSTCLFHKQRLNPTVLTKRRGRAEIAIYKAFHCASKRRSIIETLNSVRRTYIFALNHYPSMNPISNGTFPPPLPQIVRFLINRASKKLILTLIPGTGRSGYIRWGQRSRSSSSKGPSAKGRRSSN